MIGARRRRTVVAHRPRILDVLRQLLEPGDVLGARLVDLEAEANRS
jgi:hypothetical protein